LLLQLRFTPEKKRRKQLDAAEKLYAIIDSEKEYPFEFVFFRIIGFSHKGPVAQPLVRGEQLLEDLRLFITKLSVGLAAPVSAQSQKVYGTSELAETLGVSARTIQRWRKRGLIARKFIFEDGVKRLGFFQSTVDKFLARNSDLAAHAKSFTRITPKQKTRMIRRAATLASKAKLSRHAIVSKIAVEMGRSHETVRSTLVNYEKAHPDKHIFKRPPGIMDSALAAEIYKLFKQGIGVRDLMKRFNRSKSSIYRIIRVRRAKALLLKKIEFIASDEFLVGDAEAKILGLPGEGAPIGSTGKIQPFGSIGSSLPDYLRTLKNTPVLNREQEVELFRKYNYLKYLACMTRVGMKPTKTSSARIEQIEGWLAAAEKIRRTIVEANLRLVVSIARKHTGGGANLSDLISEGNFALMHAIEKFDYSRGFRFSTFGSWTIAKDFAHRMPSRTSKPSKERAESLVRMQEDFRETDAEDLAAIERAHQSLVQVIADELDDREQYIILNRFGPIGQPIKKKTKTLKQIGEDLGLTKEWVRRLELSALQKLRQSLSPKEFELLTR